MFDVVLSLSLLRVKEMMMSYVRRYVMVVTKKNSKNKANFTLLPRGGVSFCLRGDTLRLGRDPESKTEAEGKEGYVAAALALTIDS